jgi:hypothetical protein
MLFPTCLASWRCLALLAATLLAGCSVIGPPSLKQSRLQYNDVIKTTSEEEMLLNIVRLRYTDTPSSLQITNIAAQFELIKTLGLTPFFVAAGTAAANTSASVLPYGAVSGADRPTFSLTPLDDGEFARRLFTPLSLEGTVYLARTTWPIQTVFRLYLENLNWVPNGETASGPTPRQPPEYRDFLTGVAALQSLQTEGKARFSMEERLEPVGGPVPAETITADSVVRAAKEGFELTPDVGGKTWSVMRKTPHFILYIDPAALDSREMLTFAQIFRLKRGLSKYDVSVDQLTPFPSTYPAEGVEQIDLETRSLLQALFFVAHGVEVPAEHAQRGIARVTMGAAGEPFDWGEVLAGLFDVKHKQGSQRPAGAYVAVPYKDYWFYIDETDQDTKTTFALLMELARLELPGRKGREPILTLPLGGR